MSTNSRLRNDAATIFDVFCEVGIIGGSAVLLQKYPEDYCDESTLKSITQFSFPCKIADDASDAVQLFSFVLTDAQSQYTFGYCRFMPKNNTCIVILSGFPWHALFYKLLNHVSVVMNNGQQSDVDGLLTRVYHTDIPQASETLRVATLENTHTIDLEVPDLSVLPTLREDKFMLEFYNAVSPRQMVALYASLLKERRIIFTGRKLSQLSSCIHAAATLLYPMHWQYLFIPVLPESLRDMIQAPMPFLIGVPKQVADTTEIRELGDVMVIDLEEKTLQGAHDDTVDLPPDVLALLKSQLKSGPGMGDSLSRAFLRANVLLFGGYRLGFVRSEETGVISWDREKFIGEQKQSHQAFLGSLVGSDGVQFLERFIEERIKALNLGLAVTDEFEKEINAVDLKYRSQPANSEVLQQAVNSVKENANDVIGVIKDKMTSIQLRDKLGKLTPKEIRKHSVKKVPFKKISKPVGAIEPLSFENMQWTEEACESSEESRDSRGASPQDNGQSDVGDLIDLGGDAVDPLADHDPSTSTPVQPSTNPLDRPVPTPRRSLAAAQPLAPAVSSRRPPLPAVAPVVQVARAPVALPPSSSNPFAHSPVATPMSRPVVFTNPFYNMPNPNNGTANHAWEKFE